MKTTATIAITITFPDGDKITAQREFTEAQCANVSGDDASNFPHNALNILENTKYDD